MRQTLKHELRAVISGKSQVRFGATLQAVIGHLGTGAPTGTTTQGVQQIKREEAERITRFAHNAGLWQESIDISNYVSEGAEQKVYLKDPDHVLKLNDAIYFETWRDYLHNLLLHNHFFPDTAYGLVGFTRIDHVLHAMVKQRFVMSTAPTNLSHVRSFLEANGFTNTRNNDYFHPESGLILEDLHDENVLTQNDILYFIDTVFYLTDTFWTDN